MTLLPPLLQRSPLAASAAASGCSLGRRIAINSSSSSSSSSRRAFHQTTPAASARSDPYRILALDRKASKKQIKERFYELSKKYHPDLRPGDEDAKAKYLEISSAYDTLGSPAKRSAYDNSVHGRAGGGSGNGGPGAPNLTRTGRQSTWVHPSTRMGPRPKGASGPSAAWAGRRQGASADPSTTYSTGRASPFRGTAAGFGPYGHPDAHDASAWDRIAREEFAKPLRRSKPSVFETAIPSQAELGNEIHTEGLKKAFGLGMMLSIFIGLIAGFQGTMLWESDDRVGDRRRNDDDSRLARRRPAASAGLEADGSETELAGRRQTPPIR